MDLETENKIAAILLREAAEMRRQAEKEGVHVYLQPRKTRSRPNSRFLAATVLGVQQSNNAMEVSEMWRVREKELELTNRRCPRASQLPKQMDGNFPESAGDIANISCDDDAVGPISHSKRFCCRDVDGLKDEEVDAFLHSRAKRGRGDVGCRMDETGPYLPGQSSDEWPTGAKEHLSLCAERQSSWELRGKEKHGRKRVKKTRSSSNEERKKRKHKHGKHRHKKKRGHKSSPIH